MIEVDRQWQTAQNRQVIKTKIKLSRKEWIYLPKSISQPNVSKTNAPIFLYPPFSCFWHFLRLFKTKEFANLQQGRWKNLRWKKSFWNFFKCCNVLHRKLFSIITATMSQNKIYQNIGRSIVTITELCKMSLKLLSV